METKDKIINTNNNTNNINLNVKVEHPKPKTSRKKSEPNWYQKKIVWGIIAIAISVCSYYIKKNMDNKIKAGIENEHSAQPIVGKKEN